jgi:hypothetical protein
MEAAAALPANMRAGIDGYVRERNRRLGLLRCLLIAESLTRLFRAATQELTLHRLGRPQLTGDLDLSIGHTDGLACAAISHGCRVGVDVEARSIRRYFGSPEILPTIAAPLNLRVYGNI